MRAAWMLGAAVLPAMAANAANRLGLFFDNSFNFIAEYQNRTSMLVTGRCNREDARFTAARQAGAEVLAYIDPVDISPNLSCQDETDLYTVNGGPAPHWSPERYEYQSKSGVHYPLADLGANSAWSNHVVAYVEGLMRENKVDGVFLDVVGARLWSSQADWNSWSPTEQQAWTEGNIDLVRRLNASRLAINPKFIIVNNNTWDGTTTGTDGEQYVDGICLQGHDVGSYMADVAGRTYAPSGHKRVLVLPKDHADVSPAAQISGVTDVSIQTSEDGYGSPAISMVGVVTPTPLSDRLDFFGYTSAGNIVSAGLGADFKRASKFTLPQQGRLRALSVNLDGNGGASGTQTVKLVLYRDNNGVPGAKVLESSGRTLSAGAGQGWYSFTVDQALLAPGTYWIALLTGGTAQVLRDYGNSTPNWYGNADVYTDGASDPFGSGNAGSVTLSIRGSYSPE